MGHLCRRESIKLSVRVRASARMLGIEHSRRYTVARQRTSEEVVRGVRWGMGNVDLPQ